MQPSSYTFTPNKEEVIDSRFRLRFSTTCNSYYRDWSDAIDPSAKGVISGWDKVLYSVDSVRRIVNEEIGQVYLERISGSNTGCIKWHIDFGCCGLLVDEVTMRLSCVEDYGGEIVVTLMGNPGQKRVRYPIGSDYVTFTELENSTELTLTIHFIGEAGQVTRLFPQSILRGMGYPLDLQVILKQPLQSLGKPRILLGLLYSSSQEIEVDSRHYKQNTTNPGQGFLHIHLLRGMDLPPGKHGAPETFSKCYLLNDAKKSTKCRTKTRKGKDPLWNEQFLIVGVNYHDVKRRALEMCIVDSHTSVGRKAKFVGGVRLSLGYKAVVAAQTRQVNQVLRFLKGKGGMSGRLKSDKDETEGTTERGKETVMANVNASFDKWKKSSVKKPVASNDTGKATKAERPEDAETTDGNANDKNSRDVTKVDIAENGPQSASSTSTEEMTATDSVPDPSQNSGQDLKEKESETSSSSTAPTRSNRLAEQRLFEAVMASIKQLEIAARYAATEFECSEEGEKEPADKLDDQQGVVSCGNDDFEKKEDPLAINDHPDGGEKEEFEEHESNEISTQSIENGADGGKTDIQKAKESDPIVDGFNKTDEQTGNESGSKHSLDTSENSRSKNVREENILKENETQLRNGDPAEVLLNGIKENEQVMNHLAEKENPPTDLSENSRTEHDQKLHEQNANEHCTDVKDTTKEESSTKEDSSLNTTDPKTHESVKILKGKPSNSSEQQIQEIKPDNLESEKRKPQKATRKASSGPSDLKRSPSFTLKDIGKRLSFRRNSKMDGSGESRSETGLETNANKMMLDAQGLEITQWKLVVERPKQWHYCWHILRSEMAILH